MKKRTRPAVAWALGSLAFPFAIVVGRHQTIYMYTYIRIGRNQRSIEEPEKAHTAMALSICMHGCKVRRPKNTREIPKRMVINLFYSKWGFRFVDKINISTSK